MVRRLRWLIAALACRDRMIPATPPYPRHAERFGYPLPALAGGAPDPDPDPAPDPDPDPDPAPDPDPDPAPDPDSDKEPDWKRESRKHEARAKADKKRADALQAELDKIKNADKSDQEKAIDDAKAEVRAELDAERRHDRLEVAVTRLAARTFADTEDALIHLERAIKAGDVDQDDIFDNDGKVQTDAVKTALTELLERKPHLAAGDGTPPPGDSDAGKGRGSKGTEAMSPADHYAQIRAGKRK